MRRFTIYLLLSLLTFGVGSLIAFSLYQNSENKYFEEKKVEIVEKNSLPDGETFQTVATVDSEQNLPVIFQENDKKQNPFCRDEKILPVWKLIKNDRYFLEQSGGLFINPNCSDMFEVSIIDLNQDKSKEIILRGKSPDLCGGVGNCGFWIFEKKGKKYQKILSASDYVDITEMGEQISKKLTKGFYDIITKVHLNAADTRHLIYKFDGQKYTESECSVNHYVRGSNPNPKWKFISCPEYEKIEN